MFFLPYSNSKGIELSNFVDYRKRETRQSSFECVICTDCTPKRHSEEFFWTKCYSLKFEWLVAGVNKVNQACKNCFTKHEQKAKLLCNGRTTRPSRATKDK